MAFHSLRTNHVDVQQHIDELEIDAEENSVFLVQHCGMVPVRIAAFLQHQDQDQDHPQQQSSFAENVRQLIEEHSTARCSCVRTSRRAGGFGGSVLVDGDGDAVDVDVDVGVCGCAGLLSATIFFFLIMPFFFC